MALTPCLRYQEGDVIDYLATADIVAGQVIVIGTIPAIAPVAIPDTVNGVLAITGIWKVPQKAEIITAGDAVYWDASGNPCGGTASTGAATAASASVYLMGVATATTTAADTYVYVSLSGVKRTATIGGAVTASDIEAEDASLNINGIDAAQGGLVAIAAGTSATTGLAGGAASVTGGVPGATGIGGAASVTGGVGGATNGAGGAASIVGGAAALGASAGGAVAVTGGIGKTTQAGGAVAATGGVGGATGAGGAVTVTGGIGGATSGTGGAVAVAAGAATDGNATGGALSLDAGAKHGSGDDGAITIGATSGLSLTLGLMPRLPVAAVAAAGTNIATAAACAEGISVLSASDNTKGVQLPSCVDGAWCVIVNQVPDKTVKIFPPLGKQINGVTANAAITLEANGTAVLFSEGTNSYVGGLATGIMS